MKTDSYDERLQKSQSIKEKTDVLIATGQYGQAYTLYLTDPLHVEGITERQFVEATLKQMQQHYENYISQCAHSNLIEG